MPRGADQPHRVPARFRKAQPDPQGRGDRSMLHGHAGLTFPVAERSGQNNDFFFFFFMRTIVEPQRGFRPLFSRVVQTFIKSKRKT